MAPNTRRQGRVPGEALPSNPLAQASAMEDNGTPLSFETLRRPPRQRRSQSLSSSAANTRGQTSATQMLRRDDYTRLFHTDSQSSSNGDVLSSTSGTTYTGLGRDHLSSPIPRENTSKVKKRRRLSIRPEPIEASTGGCGSQSSSSSQHIGRGQGQPRSVTNLELLAEGFDLWTRGQVPAATGTHVRPQPSATSNQTGPQLNPHAQAFIPTSSPPTPATHILGSATSPNYSQRTSTYMPPNVFEDDEDLIPELHESLSDLIPGSFGAHQQHQLRDILRQHSSGMPPETRRLPHDSPTIPGTKYPMPPEWKTPVPIPNPLGVDGKGWPANVVPVEIFELVCRFLSRDDLLNMRLVSHEFEVKLSSRIFQTVVVPFKPDIYGMADSHNGKIILEAKVVRSSGRQTKGKGRQQLSTIVPSSPGRPLSDGMEVFRLWGQNIKKFAFTFELDKVTFYKLPAKDYYEDQVAFWGKYKWPRLEYTRFKSCEQLEEKADETRCMTLALSHLKSLNELGLAVDSGLGWIEGPDCSDRVHLFAEKQKIFGYTYDRPSESQRDKQLTWDAIIMESRRYQPSSHEQLRLDATVNASTFSPFLYYRPTTFQTIHRPYYESVAIPNLAWAQVPVQDVHPPLIFRGIDLERGGKDADNILSPSSYPSDALAPNELKYSHIEWLMENEWAQQAFLTSLTLSVTDNASNFRNIQTLNIAKLSSRYLSALSNQGFWSALPNLQTLRMYVSPDWRDIVRGSDEILQAAMICPSSAGKQFYEFLEACVAGRESITSLDIGWLGGGERATGLFARNQHILPAPVLSFTDPEEAHLSCKVLKLPFVKHLTLTNCWFHPSALKVFARRMEMAKLQTLKLDSVSLTALANTANTTTPAQAGNVNNIPQPVNNPHLVLNQNPANIHLLPPPPGQMAVMGNVQPPPVGNGNGFLGTFIPPIPAYVPPPPNAPVAGTFRLQPANTITRGMTDQDSLASLNTFHPYMQYPGRAVVNATAPRGGHLSHWAAEQPGPDNACLEGTHRNGSWGEVIDKITPGKTIDQLRAFPNDGEAVPQPRKPTSLKRIEFVSCGYVRLTHHRTIAQNTIPEVMSQPPRCLRHRHKVLSKIMMRADYDVLLGTIAPAMPQQESDVLQVAFNMRMGWEEDDMSQYEPREDGQPIGGSGRFSGVVQRGDGSEDAA